MKKWVVIACILGLLLFALAWLGGRERVSVYREQVETLEQQVAQDSENQMMRRRLERLKEEKGDSVRLEDALAMMPEPARRYYRGGLSNLDDISFYGEVVDQHGNPVSGATFDIDVTGSFLVGGGKIRAVSKEDGFIKIETQGGRFISVVGIAHPRCYFVSPAQKTRGHSALDFYGYQPDERNPELLWADYTATNPYVFRMWCAENLEKVISGQAGAVGPGRPREDGNYSRFVTIDLEADSSQIYRVRKQSRIENHDAPGHIRIAMFSEPYGGWTLPWGEERMKMNEEERAWWVELSVVDGGLAPVPEDDIYMNEAPETGYQPMIRFEGRDKVNAKTRRPLYYYFKANGGRQYGVIVVRMEYVSSLNSGQAVEFSYKMNVEGSRNLVVMGWAQ